MQVPALPVIAHDLQVPVQVVEQQTPCAQIADLQSVLAPQLAPGGLSPQLPLTQKFPLTGSASAERVVLQGPVVPPMNGAQDGPAAAEQWPAPSQRPANVSVEPV